MSETKCKHHPTCYMSGGMATAIDIKTGKLQTQCCLCNKWYSVKIAEKQMTEEDYLPLHLINQEQTVAEKPKGTSTFIDYLLWLFGVKERVRK